MNMKKKFYYKSGVDISSTKSMCEFILNHFQYYTMSSWNGLKSIANNVKLYNLGLEGDWSELLDEIYEQNSFLVQDINSAIKQWESEHKGYSVGFNGRSDGYLVLYSEGNFRNILPNYLEGLTTYQDVKDYLKDYGESISWYKSDLRFYTKLIRDFDRLCDDLRLIVNNYLK